MVCTAEQLQRAVASHEESACGGPHFSSSRLLTPEWDEELTGWVGSSVATDEWMLCSSSVYGRHDDCRRVPLAVQPVHRDGERGPQCGI